jgi:hypothetical protein
MKIDFIKTIIALCIGALLAYANYEICDYEQVKWAITFGSFVTLTLPLVLALGVSVEHERSSIVLGVLSWVFFAVELISNSVFVFFDFSMPLYVILNGLVLLTYVLIYNTIYRAKM